MFLLKWNLQFLKVEVMSHLKKIIKEDLAISVIAIDSIFTPIKNVNYNIENYRVGQKTDFEKLNINITTDGSIEPKQALTEASKILIQHFMFFLMKKLI